MLDYFLYISVRFLSFLFCLFPIKYTLFWARATGAVFYYLLPRRAGICLLNLKLALGQSISFAERKKITREVFKNLAMNFAELLYFPKIDEKYIRKYVKIIGDKRINSVLDRNKGLIFFAAHFGNWELSSLVGQAKGYPMVVLARRQKFPRLNSLLNSYRRRLGARVISRGSMMRELLGCLRENKVVGILGDQKAGTSGILVEFFGRLVWTPTGAITLSRHTGAGILPAFMVRENGPFHRLEIGDELQASGKNSYPLKEFNNILEKYIREYPSQWLWFHRRWKASPNKNILILSDGKAGHLNQAKAVAGIIEEVIEKKIATGNRQQAALRLRSPRAEHPSIWGARREAGQAGYRLQGMGQVVRTKILEVEFRNRFAKIMVDIFGLLCKKKCTGCLRCLRLSLQKNTFDEISRFFADMVISCGWNLAALNLILAEENQAKSIAIMKPGLVPVKRFDLAIVPAHDRLKPGSNIVITQAALNLIDEDAMKEGVERIRASGFQLQASKRNIGVLIGGESKNYTLTREIANILVDELLNAAGDLDTQLLVTTSRRTTPEVDRLIKERLSQEKYCPLLIIANEKNIEGAVPGILGLSDVVVVSEESISMTSEALSSGKPVIVFETQKRGRVQNTKHRRFLDNLVSQNYLTLVKPEKLSAEIKRVYRGSKIIRPLEDKRLVSDEVRELI